MSQADWAPGNPFDRSITGFCIRHGSSRGPMSKAAYHRLKAKGRGPKETYIGARIIITPDAEQEWDRQHADGVGGTEAELQARVKKIRAERMAKAVAKSRASPNHISKQRKGRGKKKPR
jgi:hypothetical protein